MIAALANPTDEPLKVRRIEFAGGQFFECQPGESIIIPDGTQLVIYKKDRRIIIHYQERGP